MSSEMSKDETPKQSNTKVDCKCRRSVLSLLQKVENHVSSNVVSENLSSVSRAGIAQTYKSSLLSNILIEGKALKGDEDDLDTTTEYEPFDSTKEHHIEHVLMDQLDRQIVHTTRLRKSASRQVRKKMKHLIKPQLKYLALVSAQTKPASQENTDNQSMETQSEGEVIETQSGAEVMETDASLPRGAVSFAVSLDEAQSRLQAAAEKCSYVRQNCEDMLQKSRDLSQAMHILKQSEQNEVTKVLYETPPSTPNVSSDRPTLNKDLFSTKNISKKLLI